MKDLKNKALNNNYMQRVKERIRYLFINQAFRQWLYPRGIRDLPSEVMEREEDRMLREQYFDKIPGFRMDGDGVELRLESLTAIGRMLGKTNYELAEIFKGIHPRRILEHFGPDVLYLIRNNLGIFHEEMIGDILRQSGIDPSFLGVAHETVHKFEEENYTSDIVRATYELMCRFDRVVSSIELRCILAASTRRTDLECYSLKTVNSTNNSFGYGPEVALKFDNGDIAKYSLNLDGSIGFLLLYKDKPTAITAFHPSIKRKKLIILQMQGVTPIITDGYNSMPRPKELERVTSPKGLFNLDWKKALVEICAEIARRIGFEEVGILRAEKNKWIEPNSPGETALLIERARRIYDETAERMGFTAPGTDGILLKRVAELTLPKSSSSHFPLHVQDRIEHPESVQSSLELS